MHECQAPSSDSRRAAVMHGGFCVRSFSGASPLGAQAPGFGFGASSTSSAAVVAAAAAAAAGSGSGKGVAASASAAAPRSSAPPRAPAAASGADDGNPPISSSLDGEIAQHMRHLSKRDSVTRLKALQALRAVVRQRVEGGTPQVRG